MSASEPRPWWLVATTAVSLVSGATVVALADHVLADRSPPPRAPVIARAPAAAPPVVPAPRPPPAPPPEAPHRSCVASWSVFFAYGSAVAPADLHEALGAATAYATEHGTAKVFVDGHADPSGDELGNLVLSKRRAHAVAAGLRANGIPRERIVERAFGAYVPVEGDASAELRRVLVSVREPGCNEEIR